MKREMMTGGLALAVALLLAISDSRSAEADADGQALLVEAQKAVAAYHAGRRDPPPRFASSISFRPTSSRFATMQGGSTGS